MKKFNKDFELAEEDFDSSYAKKLKNNPKRLEKFKQRVIADFNKTKNIPVFLMNLRILALAGNTTEIAKKASIKRPNIYRLRPSYRPSFSTVLNLSRVLGINIFGSLATE